MFKLGEVRIPEDKDFDEIKAVAVDNQGWTIDYDKNSTKVWVKKNEQTSFNFMKVKADFQDVTATTLYNVIHDAEFRTQWDDRMIEGYELCWISPNSDIGYYSVKSPKPFKNRDFVTQRCWLDYGENKDKIVFNHSVNHAKQEQKKNFVRGLSYLTAYYIIPTGNNNCTMYYLTQSNPGGSLPVWIVNMASKVFAPKLVKKLYKACLKYDKWKLKQKNPNHKPWQFPDQITVPRIDWKDILSFDEQAMRTDSVDESQIGEKECAADDLKDDKDE